MLLQYNAHIDLENHFGQSIHIVVILEGLEIVKAIHMKSPREVFVYFSIPFQVVVSFLSQVISNFSSEI
jgi:hypothetical protein